MQLVLLGGVLLVIALVLGYFYADALLPAPVGGGDGPTSRVQLSLEQADAARLIEREDYRYLRAFGEVPVRAFAGEGNPRPFAPIEVR
jgi:hypothetical protein